MQAKTTTHCTYPGCNKPRPKTGGVLCWMHYQRKRRHGDPSVITRLPVDPTRICKAENCERKAEKNGYCDAHVQRVAKHGDPRANIPIQIQIKDNRGKHPLWKSWAAMRARCYVRSAGNYANYGGRGITVCARWLEPREGFKNFCIDMGPRPEGTTIDRRDNDGNYEPSNCRWATASEQQRNKRPMPNQRNQYSNHA